MAGMDLSMRESKWIVVPGQVGVLPLQEAGGGPEQRPRGTATCVAASFIFCQLSCCRISLPELDGRVGKLEVAEAEGRCVVARAVARALWPQRRGVAISAHTGGRGVPVTMARGLHKGGNLRRLQSNVDSQHT